MPLMHMPLMHMPLMHMPLMHMPWMHMPLMHMPLEGATGGCWGVFLQKGLLPPLQRTFL